MSLIEINRNPSSRDLRIFSSVLVVFGGVAGWLIWRRFESVPLAAFIGAILSLAGVAGLIHRETARRVYVGWMIAASPLGFVVSNLILAAIYYGVVWPIGAFIRRRGRDALKLHLDRKTRSYWEPRKPDSDPRRYFRQF